MMKILEDEPLLKSIEDAAKLMTYTFDSDVGKVIAFGNGGSFSDAQHFASELSGKYRESRRPFPAMALTDGGSMSCIANDFGYNQVFKRQLEAIADHRDIVLALSTSGNSENVLNAVEYAKRIGVTVIGITGQHGKLKDFCDICIEIPHHGFADRTQEATILIIHILVMLIEKDL